MSLDKDQSYVGSELEIFKHAVYWKKYFSKGMHKYITGDVLEVGAGIGVNTRHLVPEDRELKSWTWVEPDKELAAQIEEFNADLSLPNRRVHPGFIQDLEDNRYDCIIYIDVLEHIPDASAEIAAAKTKLRPGGHLIILVPAYQFLYNEFDKAVGHFRRYDKDVLTKEVAGSLARIELYYKDSLGLFASLANKYVIRKDIPSVRNVLFWDRWIVPCSKITDRLCLNFMGKSLIGVYRNESR